MQGHRGLLQTLFFFSVLFTLLFSWLLFELTYGSKIIAQVYQGDTYTHCHATSVDICSNMVSKGFSIVHKCNHFIFWLRIWTFCLVWPLWITFPSKWMNTQMQTRRFHALFTWLPLFSQLPVLLYFSNWEAIHVKMFSILLVNPIKVSYYLVL